MNLLWLIKNEIEGCNIIESVYPFHSSEHDRKATECLLNSERYFIQSMSKATKDYLTNIPDDIQHKLLTFLNATKQILIFHTEIFYPSLKDCNLNISCICGTFKKHIETKMFHVYSVYAAHVREAQSLLSNWCSVAVIFHFYFLVFFTQFGNCLLWLVLLSFV